MCGDWKASSQVNKADSKLLLSCKQGYCLHLPWPALSAPFRSAVLNVGTSLQPSRQAPVSRVLHTVRVSGLSLSVAVAPCPSPMPLRNHHRGLVPHFAGTAKPLFMSDLLAQILPDLSTVCPSERGNIFALYGETFWLSESPRLAQMPTWSLASYRADKEE